MNINWCKPVTKILLILSGSNVLKNLKYIHQTNRKSYFNTSSSSTGDPEVNLWSSEQDIYKKPLGFKESIINFLYNRTFPNVFRVSDENITRN